MKKITLRVHDEYVEGAGVVAGAKNSSKSTILRVEFVDWDGLSKYATFKNSLGQQEILVAFTLTNQVEENIYEVPIPTEAMTEEGMMIVTFTGYTVEEGELGLASLGSLVNTATAYMRVLPSDAVFDDGSVTASLAQQLQSEIDELPAQFAEDIETAQNYADISKSWAVGGTGKREGEGSDNSKYYCETSESLRDESETLRDQTMILKSDTVNIVNSLPNGFIPMGTIDFDWLPMPEDCETGWTYCIDEDFVTNILFKRGSGQSVSAGAFVYKTADGYWDYLRGDYPSNYALPAPLFSTSVTYKKGDYVTFSNDTYRFTDDKTAGAWDSTKVVPVYVAGQYVTAGKKANTNLGDYATAEGYETTASGDYSHAEGRDTIASGDYSHAEGSGTTASNYEAHAEGMSTTASGSYSHAEGHGTSAEKDSSHAEGAFTTADGDYSHAEGNATHASGDNSHAEGLETVASGDCSHAEGGYDSEETYPAGFFRTTADGDYSHAEGEVTIASGRASHAEGYANKVTVDATAGHVEGKGNTVYGSYAHAEGLGNTAVGKASHAEGNETRASNYYSHAEGLGTTASGYCSHAEGLGTRAVGDSSHAQGEYNVGNRNNLFEIGNGSADDARSNAFEVDFSGNVAAGGTVTDGNGNVLGGRVIAVSSSGSTISAKLAALYPYLHAMSDEELVGCVIGFYSLSGSPKFYRFAERNNNATVYYFDRFGTYDTLSTTNFGWDRLNISSSSGGETLTYVYLKNTMSDPVVDIGSSTNNLDSSGTFKLFKI